MSLITRSADAAMDVSTGQFAPQITGLYAGADVDAAAPCYIKAADGKVYMTDATAATEASNVNGFAPRAVKSGQPITLFGLGARFRYAASLTPGAVLYAGATAGRLDDGVTTGDPAGCAVCINTSDIVVTRANGKHAA